MDSRPSLCFLSTVSRLKTSLKPNVGDDQDGEVWMKEDGSN